MDYENGIQMVDAEYVQHVIRYLETGRMQQSHEKYIKCYT